MHYQTLVFWLIVLITAVYMGIHMVKILIGLYVVAILIALMLGHIHGTFA